MQAEQTRANVLSGSIVGRDPELAVLADFLEPDRPQNALVLAGSPGIGKTTLWEAALDRAREQGLRVLAARASAAETQLSFAGLIDVLDGVGSEELAGLAGPQLNALEAAVLRAEPATPPPAPQAIAVGFLNALRTLAAREPLLVAIDDVQWLDAPSADALSFAARRLDGEAIRFLLAKRPGAMSALEQVLVRSGLERLDVGPLSLGAMRRLLSERLGLSLPRHLLRRIVETTLGNPLFALELGRALAERGLPATADDIPLPDAVEDLLGTRVAALPDAVRTLLLAVSLSGELRAAELAAIGDAAALDHAADAGVLAVDGDRVRASHPLLAAAAKKRSSSRERRALHRVLAQAVGDQELRALHLALATELPDAELALTIAAAAAGASARGARQEAVELAGHALRLTPEDAPERGGRLLTLAEHLQVVGDQQRAADLLSAALDSLPAGAGRGRAYLLLSEGAVTSNDEIERYLELALAESADDPALRSAVLVELTSNTAAVRVERLPTAEAWALEALTLAQLAGPDLQRLALYALSWPRALRGRPIDHVRERFLAVSDEAYYMVGSPERVEGQRLVWRGDVSRARALLTRLLAAADERAEPVSYVLQRLHICELELRAGNWKAATRLLDEWAESAEGDLLIWPMYERCRALLAAGCGLPGEADRWAAKAISRAEATGVRWDWLEALRARGMAALLAAEPARAAESLRAVWEHTRREGVDDPGAFPVAPDLVEALADLGELEEARAVTARLAALAQEQDHPWGLATAMRCGALVRLAEAWDEQAAKDLAEAAAAFGWLGLRFDRARTLLSLGRAQRRLKKWGSARASLEQAATAFDDIDSPGWADQARSELARVGGRRRQPLGELTETERQVAGLAAQGLANKEIARALFVTVHTVEGHLTRTYAKLGIRSRSQLASRLSA